LVQPILSLAFIHDYSPFWTALKPVTDIFILKWLFAFSPIGVVLILMIGFHWGGGRAGAAGWLTAFLASIFFFGADPRLLAFSQMKGILLSLNVLYIIWMALLLYKVVSETGAINAIGSGIQRFTSDKAIQLLLFGWVFSSFLQGVAGYGVPIAVVAPLLVGLGFSPVIAVAVPAIGHCWSVTFGSMGASFQALLVVSGLTSVYLGPWSALLLGLACYLCALASIHVYGGMRMIRHSALAILVVGTVMAGTQYVLVVFNMWTLGAFGASLTGLLATILVARLGPYQIRDSGQNSATTSHADVSMGLGWAFSAYLVLIVIVSLGVLVSPIKELLNQIKLAFYFPEIVSGHGWTVPAGYGKKVSVFGHGGALLGYASLISYLIYVAKGYYKPGAIKAILSGTVRSGISTSIGIVSMVCFALIMDQCGMTYLLAEGISKFFGASYPLFATWIGLLGAFMTGSNTNSNVVFGALQQQTATLAQISVAVILAAQTTGGALGSMLAPAKILVGCSTVGLSGKEGPVLAVTIKYGLLISSIIGVVTFLAVFAGAR
jgi:lactate permease